MKTSKKKKRNPTGGSGHRNVEDNATHKESGENLKNDEKDLINQKRRNFFNDEGNTQASSCTIRKSSFFLWGGEKIHFCSEKPQRANHCP